VRVGLAGVAVVVVVAALLRAAAPPAGPVEPAWDRVACARCHMLVTDPAFAAQLHTERGEVLFFDDPGCLLLHRAESAETEPGAAAWFHDSAGPRWLPEAEARFVPAPETPMGHGFAAVATGGVDASAALATLRVREAAAP
jgi:hypothetical protein